MTDGVTATTTTTTTLVTGATGFLGPHLVWEAAATGPVLAVDRREPDADVRAFLDRDPSRARRVTWATADVTDYDALVHVTRDHPITQVIHAAAITPDAAMEDAGMRQTIAVNVLGTANALDLARARAVQRTLVFSSAAVYARNDGSPLTEDAPWRDAGAYAASKQSIERLVAHAVNGFGMDVVAVRPSALFGPLERPTGAREAMSGIYGLMHAAQRGEEMRIHDDGLPRDLTAASEVARAVVRLLHAPRLSHRVYNLATGRSYTASEIRDALRAAIPQVRWQFVPPDQATMTLGSNVRTGRLAVERLDTDLGVRLNDDLAAHLTTYHAWLQAHPY